MKLPVVSGEKAIKAFSNADFVKVRQRGSHVRLEKIEGNDIIKLTVPLHNPMKKGTLSRLIKDAGLTIDEFVNLL
ncbi:MAG: type II toxin-antitoxin system HicA family toxin [Candidatus Methanomarinus sp.]|uniref:Type II toxin-antitoxin system HicA family toxin n=1 Tax=Candidatus Methanomarinus sp. TaxID=3386244 RepID=A0AC61SCI1_9EURY|nr:MAG: putative RNA binding protein YcfA, dsRBD-like fold, HicA-like mRNA interferase family [ANME-2 cluster archaeon]KAF5428723.1 putative RNA binding protein YcfA, dsRBD-like fold, HicA-like mRNA interferase family [ANME-2 cluster archaeon]TKY92352.1 MAG: type II toxin-antitoxin system HicA family toxin [ANME-2 cluster archaeon]